LITTISGNKYFLKDLLKCGNNVYLAKVKNNYLTVGKFDGKFVETILVPPYFPYWEENVEKLNRKLRKQKLKKLLEK